MTAQQKNSESTIKNHVSDNLENEQAITALYKHLYSNLELQINKIITHLNNFPSIKLDSNEISEFRTTFTQILKIGELDSKTSTKMESAKAILANLKNSIKANIPNAVKWDSIKSLWSKKENQKELSSFDNEECDNQNTDLCPEIKSTKHDQQKENVELANPLPINPEQTDKTITKPLIHEKYQTSTSALVGFAKTICYSKSNVELNHYVVCLLNKSFQLPSNLNTVECNTYKINYESLSTLCDKIFSLHTIADQILLQERNNLNSKIEMYEQNHNNIFTDANNEQDTPIIDSNALDFTNQL